MIKEEFIYRLKLKHPYNFNKYDYSLVPNKFKSIDKVKIICKIHGTFEQQAREHLRGRDCSKCRYQKSNSNTNDFISKAKLIHGTKYDYDKVNYIYAYTKVLITCKKHGDFLQQPSSHLSGYGCIKCGIENTSNLRRSNKEEFVRKAKLIHNNKYDYSKVDYINKRTKITITCKEHGDFLQRPNDHLTGKGCSKCSESKGEKYISEILDNLNIKYIREYKIDGYKYRYDFYLPEYNIYIEYHGRQHYMSVDYFGGKKGYKYIQRNDKIKIELIKRSNGLLIILDYKLNTLELIKNELLNIFNLLHPKFLENKEFTKEYINDSKAYMYNKGIMYVRK